MVEINTVAISTITAFVISAIGSYISYFFSTKKAERDARRDYEYEAKKRLYNEYEPLLFQLYELSEDALRRIFGLAREARQGSGSLSDVVGYYTANTLYRFLAPLAVFKLMQRRLTLVDLTLNPTYANQYLLAKALYHTFSHDFRLANSNPKLDYDPHKPSEDHEKCILQGIFLGTLDTLVNAMLVRESDILRVMSFGEFQNAYFKPQPREPFNGISYLLLNFHPAKRPVLWRILISQAYLYQALKNTRNLNEEQFPENFEEFKKVRKIEPELFDWRHAKEQASNNEVLIEPFLAVENYLKERFNELFENKNI
jgi:hypothetical protein